MRYALPVVIICVLSIGCKSPIANPQSSWDKIRIESDHYEIITINNYDDTSMVKSYGGGSIFTGFHKVKIDSLKAYFTMVEKDSIYHLAKSIISDAVESKAGCTEFVGDLKLDIDYGTWGNPGSSRQSIEYSGVCEWDTLSTETRQLKALLDRRIKWKNK